MGAFTIITEPTTEPVTIREAKDFLGIKHKDDDIRIKNLIKAARQWAEKYCTLSIPTQTVELSLDRFPVIEFSMDTWPLQSIDSVKYDDTSSPVTEQTLVADTDYYADTTIIQGRLRAISGWPSVAVKPNAVRIRMTAGYTTVPEQIKDGIKAYVAYLFDTDPDMKQMAESLLCSSRIL